MTKRRIILTGAAGGIGRAILEQLKNELVFVTASSQEKLDALKSEFGIQGCVCDLGARSGEDGKLSIEQAVEQAVQDFANMDKANNIDRPTSIDCLVHCAGITKDNLLIKMSDQDWDSVIDVNLRSAFRLSKEAVKYMMKQKFGRVVFITSVVGEMGNIGQANYVASKAGLTGLAKALACEWGKRNITFNCVQPGFIETAMTSGLTEEWRQQLLSKVPMQRMGNPEEVAHCVEFLLKASYVTGSTIRVNGGMLMN